MIRIYRKCSGFKVVCMTPVLEILCLSMYLQYIDLPQVYRFQPSVEFEIYLTHFFQHFLARLLPIPKQNYQTKIGTTIYTCTQIGSIRSILMLRFSCSRPVRHSMLFLIIPLTSDSLLMMRRKKKAEFGWTIYILRVECMKFWRMISWNF